MRIRQIPVVWNRTWGCEASLFRVAWCAWGVTRVVLCHASNGSFNDCAEFWKGFRLDFFKKPFEARNVSKELTIRFQFWVRFGLIPVFQMFSKYSGILGLARKWPSFMYLWNWELCGPESRAGLKEALPAGTLCCTELPCSLWAHLELPVWRQTEWT